MKIKKFIHRKPYLISGPCSAESEQQVLQIAKLIDVKKIELLAKEINLIRKKNGRLFFLGVGGSAANAAHAVNDFRKI